jgi:hypothetical protein
VQLDLARDALRKDPAVDRARGDAALARQLDLDHDFSGRSPREPARVRRAHGDAAARPLHSHLALRAHAQLGGVDPAQFDSPGQDLDVDADVALDFVGLLEEVVGAILLRPPRRADEHREQDRRHRTAARVHECASGSRRVHHSSCSSMSASRR